MVVLTRSLWVRSLMQKCVLRQLWRLHVFCCVRRCAQSRPGFPVQVSARNEMDGRVPFLGRVSSHVPEWDACTNPALCRCVRVRVRHKMSLLQHSNISNFDLPRWNLLDLGGCNDIQFFNIEVAIHRMQRITSCQQLFSMLASSSSSCSEQLWGTGNQNSRIFSF